jgi:CheY-like chemotaxis protein
MLKILVVDDNAMLARAIGRSLAEHAVTVETDATTALARIIDAEVDDGAYDLIVCDAYMPNKTGMEMLAATRVLRQPPMFILISGEADLAGAPADGVLVKPFTSQELRALITCLASARVSAKTRRLQRLA